MSTSADNLTALHGIKADLFAATREKGLDTTGRTLENLHELWGGISGGGALQAKTAVPSNVDVEVTPDDGYAALSAVTIAEALNLKPWNIRKGKTLFGVTGTADIAVTTEVPSDIPVSKDDADTAYEEAVGEAPKDEDGNDLDMMTPADDNGNITYGYFLADGFSAPQWDSLGMPDKPDIDETEYPYQILVKIPASSLDSSFTGYAYIFFAATAEIATWNGGTINPAGIIGLDALSYRIFLYYAEIADTFIDSGSSATTSAGNIAVFDSLELIWANHNIVHTEGNENPTEIYPFSTSGFTITSYDPVTTDFSAVGWRRLSYHTTGELAGRWTYDDFSTTASSGGNFLKNIIQCSREKLYYNGVEVWPNPDQSAITAEEVTT